MALAPGAGRPVRAWAPWTCGACAATPAPGGCCRSPSARARLTGYVLLDRSPDFAPALKWVVLLGGLAAAIGLLADGAPPAGAGRGGAGGARGDSRCWPARRPTPSRRSAPPTRAPPLARPGRDARHGRPRRRSRWRAACAGRPPAARRRRERCRQGAPRPGAMPQGAGGPGAATVSDDVVAFLEANRGDARWIAATTGSNAAAGASSCASGEPVMAIGGFSGGDPPDPRRVRRARP